LLRKQSLAIRLLSVGLAVSVAVVASVSAAAPPARADVASFLAFRGYVLQGYGLFNKYLVDKQPSDLAQMQAALSQAKAEIITELDGLAAAWNSSCAEHSVDTFQHIHKLSPDILQAFAISSDRCVTDAQALIGSVTDPAAVNKIGLAMNTVGPIALFANAKANFATDLLRQRLIDANQRLTTRLDPTCDVTIDNPDALPSSGSGGVTGHGACYNFTVAKPPRIRVGPRGGVFYLSAGPGRAFLSWPLRGLATPDDVVLPGRGYTVAFSAPDFSIAKREAMRGTSWEVANTALDELLPTVATTGSPLAMTLSTDTFRKPMDVIRTNGNDNIFRGVLSSHTDAANPTFAGWHPVDGALRSVAAAANVDGRVEMFGVSRVGNIFHRWQLTAGDNTGWSPWAQMDGQLSSLTVARNHDGTLQVFGVDPAGKIHTRNQRWGTDQHESVRTVPARPAVNTWTPWKQIDGSLRQAVAITDSGGRINVFGINGAGALFHRKQIALNATDPAVGGTWTGWGQVQVPAPLRSIAATTNGGHVNLFGVTNDDRLFEVVKLGDGTAYSSWSQIPGSIRYIAAKKQGGGAGRLVLVGLAANGGIYRNTSPGGITSVPGGWKPDSWNGWVSLPSVLGGNPAATSPGNQQTILGATTSVALSVSGGTYPYTWTLSGLPPGLSVSADSIVGSPVATGSYAVTATATDATGERSNTISFSWTVTAIRVPDVYYSSFESASSSLQAAGLTPQAGGTIPTDDPAAGGLVVRQSPPAGTLVSQGTVVRLTFGRFVPNQCGPVPC
jgi:hypothetical protein